MIDLGICKTERDVEIFFEGMKQGVVMGSDVGRRKNTLGKSLTIENLHHDLEIFKDNSIEFLIKPKVEKKD